MIKIFTTTIFLCSILYSDLFAGVGEAAVITLVFPYGARSGGMGEVGTALVDDESALYFNPAGLSVPNERWQWGSVSYYREPILRSLRMRDIVHYAFSGYFQAPPYSKIGGFGACYNRCNLGKNLLLNGLGNTVKVANS